MTCLPSGPCCEATVKRARNKKEMLAVLKQKKEKVFEENSIKVINFRLLKDKTCHMLKYYLLYYK